VSQTVAAGVLPLIDGAFMPAQPVSGAELLTAIDRLDALARSSGASRR
jgi:hypothetical protein